MAAHGARLRAVLLRSIVLLGVAGAVLGVGVQAAPPAAASTPAIVPAAVAGEFASVDCPVDVPAEHAARVTCGLLTVPERRTPEGNSATTIALSVAVIASRSDTPAADPLVIPTSGAQGAGSLAHLGYWLEHADWATDERDVILIEQRGDAHARPSLNCPELDLEHFVVSGELLSGPERSARRLEQIAACRARLAEQAVDVAGYTSAQSAADLADLRVALGYDAWNLYGLSYGARLALTTMRDQPAGLRSVILDASYPPNVNRLERLPEGFLAALQTLTTQCAADAECDDAYPRLREDLAAVLERMASDPVTVTVKDPSSGSPLRVRIDDAEFAYGLRAALSDAVLVPAIPFLIDRIARGDTDVLVPLAQQRADDYERFSEGLDLSIECAEEAPFNDDAAIAAAHAADPLLAHLPPDGDLREACALWGAAPLPASENNAVASDIPTLLMSGGYDPLTPFSWTEAAAQGLTRAYAFHFPTMSHGSVWATRVDDCPASIAQQFLRDPAAPPEGSCVAAMAPVDFLTARDIRPTSAVYRLNGDLIQDRRPVPLAIAGGSIVVFIVTLLYAAGYGLATMGRRQGSAPGGAVPAAAASSGLFLAYALGLALVVVRTDPLITGFGLPPGVWPLLLLPFVALAATVLLSVLLVRAWVTGEGTPGHRVMLSVSAAAGFVFGAWLLVRGLLML